MLKFHVEKPHAAIVLTILLVLMLAGLGALFKVFWPLGLIVTTYLLLIGIKHAEIVKPE